MLKYKQIEAIETLNISIAPMYHAIVVAVVAKVITRLTKVNTLGQV